MRSFAPLFGLSVALFVASATAHAAIDQKTPYTKRGSAAPRPSDFRSLTDVAELEPNGSSAQAQAVGCGNSLRPAVLDNVAAVPDSDWISFTATAGDLITIETADDGQAIQTDTILNLFSSDGVTSLASNDDIVPGLNLYSRIADFQAPYTGVYFGSIRGFNGAQGYYRANVACVSPPPPPGNDQCAGAIDLAFGTINLAGTTRFATNDYDLCPGAPVCPSSCTGFNSPGKDVVYRMNIPNAGIILNVTYDLDPSDTDASIYIVTDCGNVQTSCVAGRDSGEATPPEQLRYVFPAAGFYYLVLDAFTERGAAWTLTGCLDCSTPARAMTWGRLKSVYR